MGPFILLVLGFGVAGLAAYGSPYTLPAAIGFAALVSTTIVECLVKHHRAHMAKLDELKAVMRSANQRDKSDKFQATPHD